MLLNIDNAQAAPTTKSYCDGLDHITPTFTCWSPNPSTTEWDWIWRQGLSQGDYIKIRPLEWALLQSEVHMKEEIWTHEGRPVMCLHRGKRLWGHSRKAVTCTARREASEETHLPIPDFELPNSRTERKGTPVAEATWSGASCHGSPSKLTQLPSPKCQLCQSQKTLVYGI